jgi:hypothetical protein
MGWIIGCPARLICRQPPASVASAVTPQKPIVVAPNALSGTSRTIELTVVLAKALTAVSWFHPVRSTAAPLATALRIAPSTVGSM